jgi:hypothetical protein
VAGAVRHHAVVKFADDLAAGLFESEWQQSMYRTTDSATKQRSAESRSGDQMLAIGFANAGRVFCKFSPD